MDVSRREIWEKLTAVKDYPVKQQHTKDGPPLDYVNVYDAHDVMMTQFPNYTWEFERNEQGQEAFYYGDTAEVRCAMTISGHTHVVSLGVTGEDFEIAHNPTSADIHNTKQRCRVKAMAEFGLFIELYKPRTSPVEEAMKKKPEPKPEQTDDVEDKSLLDHWVKQKEKSVYTTKAQAQKFLDKFNNHMRGLSIEENDIDRKKREDQFWEEWKPKRTRGAK